MASGLEYVPTGQMSHFADPFEDTVPFAHREHLVLRLAEELPAAQISHSTAPVSEYSPAGQSSHTAPPIAYVPAEQFEKHVSEREGLTVPGGQGAQ